MVLVDENSYTLEFHGSPGKVKSILLEMGINRNFCSHFVEVPPFLIANAWFEILSYSFLEFSSGPAVLSQ